MGQQQRRRQRRRQRGQSEGVELGDQRKPDPSRRDHIDQIAAHWREDVTQVWARDIAALPVHIDLPRMAHKMSVVGVGDDGARRVLKGLDSPKDSALRDLLTALCDAVHGGEEGQRVGRAFDAAFAGTNLDQARVLKSLLVAKDVFPDARAPAALRFCCQSIIFPAYYFLKCCLGNDGHDVPEGHQSDGEQQHQDQEEEPRQRRRSRAFSCFPSRRRARSDAGVGEARVGPEELRDQRGSWAITIEVLASGQARITHSKGQRSAALAGDTEEPEYEFSWELSCLTSPDMAKLDDVAIRVPVQPRFHALVGAARRNVVLGRLRRHGLWSPEAEEEASHPHVVRGLAVAPGEEVL